MNQDEHQRERMRAWAGFARVTATFADERLCEFDKRFPAPAAVEVAKAPALTTMSLDVAETILAQEAELASLREKARLWDAVGSGKVRLMAAIGNGWRAEFAYGGARFGDTAEEAVQAAIDAGALK